MSVRKLSPKLREKLDAIADHIFEKASRPVWTYDDGTHELKRQPLTVPMLAARAGVSVVTVRRLMNRETQFPRWDTLQKLLWAVSCDFSIVDMGSLRALPAQTISERLMRRIAA